MGAHLERNLPSASHARTAENSGMIYGLLSYETTNLGDQIQSIAARQFLPQVDVLLNRDALDLDSAPNGAHRVHAILNGWFLEHPEHWPPHPRIRPLLLSMHLDTRRARKQFWRPSAAERMLQPRGRDWLIAHGPVGARDLGTLAFLQCRGVPSWYSGCLTLTLPETLAEREDVIVACDLPERYLDRLKQRTRSRVVAVTHRDLLTSGHAARMAKAQALLDLYGRARAVVTSRLHCTLPCLAFGTPVLFVPVVRDRKRQQPAIDLAHSATPAAFLSGRYDFDLDRPPRNPEGWRTLARTLRKRCLAFLAPSPTLGSGPER